MKNNKLITVLTLSMFLLIFSCKKDETEVIDNSTISSKDNSAAENLFADIKKVVEEAADDEGQSAKLVGNDKSGAYSFGACATVTISPAWGDPNWPKVMEIDFGPTNCTGAYGIDRRGKLIVTLTDRYRNQGSVLTVQTQSYFINDVKVEGIKTLTNNGYNASNNLEYVVNVSNAVITYTDNTTLTWSSTRTNEWIQGDSTTLFTHGLAGICDDVYLITGSANGVNRNGLAYTVNITSPLRKEVCCRWIVSGSLDIVPSSFSTRIVDFGTGTCDNQATVTINGNVYNVSMW